MVNYTYHYEDAANELMVRKGDDGSVIQFGTDEANPMYREFLASGATAVDYVAPAYVAPAPTAIELLEARVAAIEADEISDDASSSALLTIIADLVLRVAALEGTN